MVRQPIRFNDGAAYERQIGVWSRYAGQIFLDWLAPGTGLRWIDVDSPLNVIRPASGTQSTFHPQPTSGAYLKQTVQKLHAVTATSTLIAPSGAVLNLEASVRSRDTDDAKGSDRDLIEAGLN